MSGRRGFGEERQQKQDERERGGGERSDKGAE